MPVLDLHDRPCIILRTDLGMTLMRRGGTVDGACLPARRAQVVCTPGCDDPFDRLWHLFADPNSVNRSLCNVFPVVGECRNANNHNSQ